MVAKKKFLGELLIEAGLITKAQRDKALKEQRRLGKRLGETLVEMGLVSEINIAEALSAQLGMPFRELKAVSPAPDVVSLIPEVIARRHRVLPVTVSDGKLTLAMADPLDVFAIDEIRRITRMSVDAVVTTESELLKAIDKFYKGAELDEALKAIEAEPRPAEAEREAAEETPGVRLINTVIAQGVKGRASDIHIEAALESLRVRFRIDGILHEVMRPPKHMHPGIVSRVKILSGMDIAEKRVPQDGRFPVNIEGRQFDIRASTLPTLHGEKIVLRLLEKTTGLPTLQELGFSEETLRTYERLIQKPYGFLLSTGPTGCGKTTTMYSSLRNIHTTEKNIITVEDPIEYNIKEINQVQINPKAGLTFASGLRSILRQDPDVIMVGEIRDLDTAAIATHAALTGHMVLSTLHTNEAVGAIARLIDMGVEPFLITSSLIGVLGQRLIRRICPHCKQSFTIKRKADKDEMETMVHDAPDMDIFREIGLEGREQVLYRGAGCEVCRNTGYLGREGLFELLLITEGVKKLIVQKAPASAIKAYAVSEGFRTMRQEGFIKALKGITTIQEVMRVTEEAEAE